MQFASWLATRKRVAPLYTGASSTASKEQSAKQKSGTPVMHFAAGPRWSGSSSNLTSDQQREELMSQSLVDEAKVELEAAQSTLDAALHAWDQSVSELWRTSLALTQAQKRVTRAHELLRDALAAADE